MINKNPTIEDVYNFDYYISTPGVREGLMQQSEIGGEEFSVEDTDDGQAVYFNTPYGEQVPVGRPVLLAMGSSGYQPGVSSERPITDAAMGLGDMLAGALRGTVAQATGLPGDLEMLARGLRSVFSAPEDQSKLEAFVSGLEQKTFMPTTERMNQILPPVVPAGAADAASRKQTADVANTLGEFNPLTPAVVGPAIKGAKALGDTLGPVAADMAGDLLQKQGLILNAVPLEQFPKLTSQMAAKVDKGTVKISDKVTQGQVLQLQPQYRVKITGFKPEGKNQNITNTINPGNYNDISLRLNALSESFPDPLESPEKFSAMLATVYNSAEVPIPPRWMIDNANDMGKWSSWFGTMTKGQLDEANRGFAVVDKFKGIYTNGQASPETTGRLMMWSMMSRKASAYPHESGFLDLAEPMTPLIQKALRGEYGPADVEAGLELIKQSIPAGSPGKMVTSNANDFVRTFLPKMSEKLPDGRTKLQALHEMIADPSMTGPQIRREFYGLAEDVGIKNKVLSFALLVSGREDVMVLDRIQINRLFAGGDKIYDDVAHLFDGGPGLAIYEGLERSLGKRVNELYTSVGRGDQASLGRYHWESWVLSSGQEVAHPTLETIVKSAKGEADAFAGVPVKEGRMHERAFNVTYERTPDGKNRFVFPTASGAQFEFTKPALDELFGQVMDKKNGIIPKDFPGVKFFSKDTLEDGSPNPYFGKPWYSWPGVNRERIDELAATFGTKLNPSRGGAAVEGTGAGKAASGSVRAAPKAGTERAVKRGRQASNQGAN